MSPRYENLTEEKTIFTHLTKEQVDKTLEEMVSDLSKEAWETDSGIVGKFNKSAGNLTVRYRYRKFEYVNDDCFYQTYYISAKILKSDDDTYTLRYSFIHIRPFRLRSLIVAMLTVLLIELPMIIKYPDPIRYLILFGFYLLVGLIIAFGDKEKKEDAEKTVELFETEMNKRFALSQ